MRAVITILHGEFLDTLTMSQIFLKFLFYQRKKKGFHFHFSARSLFKIVSRQRSAEEVPR